MYNFTLDADRHVAIIHHWTYCNEGHCDCFLHPQITVTLLSYPILSSMKVMTVEPPPFPG